MHKKQEEKTTDWRTTFIKQVFVENGQVEKNNRFIRCNDDNKGQMWNLVRCKR